MILSDIYMHRNILAMDGIHICHNSPLTAFLQEILLNSLLDCFNRQRMFACLIGCDELNGWNDTINEVCPVSGWRIVKSGYIGWPSR